jgi:hypothetical protein
MDTFHQQPQNNPPTEKPMTEFSQKRFVDLGQTLYTEWLSSVSMANATSTTEEERRLVFKFIAEASFEAAEEFAKVFRYQEDS